jgi:hypothetical protein
MVVTTPSPVMYPVLPLDGPDVEHAETAAAAMTTRATVRDRSRRRRPGRGAGPGKVTPRL